MYFVALEKVFQTMCLDLSFMTGQNSSNLTTTSVHVHAYHDCVCLVLLFSVQDVMSVKKVVTEFISLVRGTGSVPLLGLEQLTTLARHFKKRVSYIFIVQYTLTDMTSDLMQAELETSARNNRDVVMVSVWHSTYTFCVTLPTAW